MMLSDVCLSVWLSDVCLSRTSGLSREQRCLGRLKLAHVTRTPLSRSKGQRSRSPGRFTHYGVNASGSCSGERGNVLAMGTYCYVAVCTLQVRSARRREALRRPQREERGGAYCGGRPPTACLECHTVSGDRDDKQRVNTMVYPWDKK